MVGNYIGGESVNIDNKTVLQQICDFADMLLKKVLEERCNPNEFFYLPGMAVLDEELLGSLSYSKKDKRISTDLQKRWIIILDSIVKENVDRNSSRMAQLYYLYEPKEIWLFAICMTFVYSSDPKYKKAFSILQRNIHEKGIDAFLLCALAQFIGIECDVTQFQITNKMRNELFETSTEGYILMRNHVFLWLNGLDDGKLSQHGIVKIYSDKTDKAIIRMNELDWCSQVAKRQCEENIEDRLIFELQGKRGSGRKYFCLEIAERLGYRLCVVQMSVLLEMSEKERYNCMQEIYFNCTVNGCILYLEIDGFVEEHPDAVRYLREFASEYSIMFIGVGLNSTIAAKVSLMTQRVSFEKLAHKDSLILWKWIGNGYPVDEVLDYEQIAGRYRLLPGTIKDVFDRAERVRWEKNVSVIDFSMLISCIRSSQQVISNTMMERIETAFEWDDLKVEQQVVNGMKLACAHLQNRFNVQEKMGKKLSYGGGISVLMYGPPGTGKTMAAQVIANELQMDLYRVDLSQVSSKYIGETEKNLEQIFRDAQQANVILFFDEADCMFGKRTEVRDANDKYANQETSYILQRIESYDGMVILASNFAQNFDSAFMRRITVSIRFSLPNAEMRKKLWINMLENSSIVNDSVMMEALSEQFELSGSNIKNIVRNAEVFALMKQKPLTIVDVVMAIKLEYEKLGKICNSASFGNFAMYIY